MGGLPVEELNLLELEFLKMNNFNIHVSVEELQQYGNQLLMHSIREENRLKQRELNMYINNNEPCNNSNYNLFTQSSIKDV